jgi:hypothetical protein
VSLGYQANVGLQGDDNIAAGTGSMNYVQGSRNIGLGNNAGVFSLGDANVAAGDNAGLFVQGSNNIALGRSSGTGYYFDTTAGTLTDRDGNAVDLSGGFPAIALNNTVAMGNRKRYEHPTVLNRRRDAVRISRF